MDGAVASNTPILTAAKLGATRISPSSRFCLLGPHAAEWRDRVGVACDHPSDS